MAMNIPLIVPIEDKKEFSQELERVDWNKDYQGLKLLLFRVMAGYEKQLNEVTKGDNKNV